MPASRRFRLSALLAGASIIAATLLPALPAVAADPPITGTVSIDNSATPLVATPASWPGGTTYAYRWYRGSTASTATTAISGSGASTAFYTPTSADYGKFLRVKVTATVPGYSPVSRYSAAKNYSLVRTGTASITGTLKVGTQLTVDPSGLAYSTFNGAAVPDGLVYQWLRNGAAISGSDASDNNDYTLQSADYGQSISLRITAAKAGWVSNVYKTGSKTVSTKGTLVQVNNVVTTATGLTRTAQAAFADVLPAATKMTYQWYRNGVAITDKTSSSYKLTSADYGKVITVKVKYYRSNYTTLTLSELLAASGRYSVQATTTLPVIHIGGPSVPNVGGTLSVDDRTYNDMTDGSTIADVDTVKTYQWYRSGTAISTADGGKYPTYTLKPVDKGKTITVKVTVSVPTLPHLLPSVATSKATKTIGTAMIPGWDDIDHAPATLDAPSTAFTQILVAPTADAMGFDAPLTGLTLKYQWYRGDPIAGTATAIADKTTSKYTLTQSDSGLDVWVRVTISKAAVGSTTYTTIVKDSTHTNYTLTPSGSPDIYTLLGAPFEVGTEINVGVPSFFDSGSAQVLPISQQKQWYRNGVAISVAEGGTGNTYVLKAADAGKTISVKVTSGKLGYLANIATFTATPTPLGTLVGPTTAPTVTVSDPATNTLQATPAGDLTGSAASGSPIAAFSYQWLRDGSVIANQTAATYNLKAADLDHLISVRVTAKLAGYTTVVLPDSDGIDYSIQVITGSEPYASSNYWALGESPTVYGLNFQTKDGPLSSPTIAFQWLRGGVPISGATSQSYALQAADVGQLITVRLTVSAPGYVTLVYTPNGTVAIGGTTTTDPTATVIPGAGLGTLTGQLTGLVPAYPLPVYTYKWFRSGTASAVSTASTYALTSADTGHTISLQVTMTRAGFAQVTTVLPTTTPVDYSILGSGVPTISGTVAVGLPLTATPPTFYENDGTTPLGDTPTYTYKWYRSGTAISGQSGDTYTLVGADKGKTITVKVTASLPGRVPRTSGLSSATATVAAGTFSSTTPSIALVPVFPTRPVLHVDASTSVDPTPEGPATLTYKWYRNGTAITGATAATYTPVPADAGQPINVKITATRSGYTTLVITVSPVGPFDAIQAGPLGKISDTTPHVGQTIWSPYLNTGDPGADDGQFFQWYVGSTKVSGATTDHFTVPASASGKTIKVRVSGYKDGYIPIIQTSAPTSTVP